MTETEWLTSTTFLPMLEFLRGKASDRKLRLLAIASCLRIWDCFTDERSRVAIEAVCKYADGLIDTSALIAARNVADGVPRWKEEGTRRSDLRHWKQWASEAALACCALNSYPPLDRPVPQHEYFTTTPASVANVLAALKVWNEEEERLVRGEGGANQGDDWVELLWDNTRMQEYKAQADFLRDIFGNPFRPITIDPTWLTSTVLALANGIYSEKAFDRMAILADALQDSGCSNEEVLNHCRSDGVHVRGCFVVDKLLGKE
ncbi:MAG TPA: hypothetical protein VG097_17495 [Gemmata sp.]|nr:hypothetical protein [Gemmata sp.]